MTSGRQSEATFAGLLPWKILHETGDVVTCEDGGFLSAFEFSCPDGEMLSGAQHDALILSINQELHQLALNPGSWSFYLDARRAPVLEYDGAGLDDFAHPLPFALDAERTAQFSGDPHFVTVFHISVKRTITGADKSMARIMAGITGDKDDSDEHRANATIQRFIADSASFESSMANILPSFRRLSKGELCSYLHGCGCPPNQQKVEFSTNGKPHLFLDAWLASGALVNSQPHPKIIVSGVPHHFAVISVTNYPPSITPVFSEIINKLPFEARYCIRFCAIADNVFKTQLFMRRQRLAASAQKKMSGADELVGSTHDERAVEKSHDAHAALIAFDKGEKFGKISTSFVIWDTDLTFLREKVSYIEETCRLNGIIAKMETFQATSALLGSLPGEDVQNVRSETGTLENVVFLSPWVSTWGGHDENYPNSKITHPQPPLFQAVTSGKTPFRYSPQPEKDLPGHAFVVGATGAGKSTMLLFYALQFLKYGGSIYYFDKGRSSLVATTCSGGAFYDFGNEAKPQGVRPLSRLDTAEQITDAQIWLRHLINDRVEDGSISDTEKQDASSAVELLSRFPPELRTLENLRDLAQGESVKVILSDYIDGAYAGVFDAGDDIDITSRSWCTFEINEILKRPEISKPLLRYLFRTIMQQIEANNKPSLVVVDEAYDFLSDSYFKAEFDRMLRQLRKFDAQLLIATQSIVDLFSDDRVRTTITNNVLNRIYLPSKESEDPQLEEILVSILNLSETHLSHINNATPKRDYFIQNHGKVALVSLDLREVALALCATGNKRDLTAAISMRMANELDAVSWLSHKKINPTLISQIQEFLQ